MTKQKLFIIIYFFICFSTVCILIIKENIFYLNAGKVNEEIRIDTTKVTKANTTIRGGIYLKNVGFLNTAYSTLITNPNNFKNWKFNGPETSYNDMTYVHTLDDLPFPYLIYKNNDNDTIYVNKDTFDLYFRLGNIE